MRVKLYMFRTDAQPASTRDYSASIYIIIHDVHCVFYDTNHLTIDNFLHTHQCIYTVLKDEEGENVMLWV